MSEDNEPTEVRSRICGQCGQPLTLVSDAVVDDLGARRVEFQCSNGHGLVLNIVETDGDDADPAV
jgi:hypothetical protein